MTLDDLEDEFRSQVADQEAPFLWSDDEVFRYVVDAQDMFARNTGGIADATTPELTMIKAKTGVPFAAYSPYILRFRFGRMVTARQNIEFINIGNLSGIVTTDYGIQNLTVFEDDDTGPVTAAILGTDNHKLRWFKVPSADDVMQTQIFRLPYPRLEGTDDDLEIDEQHHRHLILWMKHLAYSKQDAETYDKKAAEDNKRAFEEYTTKAKQEKDRLRFHPRTVSYGGL